MSYSRSSKFFFFNIHELLPIYFQDHKPCKDHYKKVKKLNKYLTQANDYSQAGNWNEAFEALDSAEGANKDDIHETKTEIWQMRCRGRAELREAEHIADCNK